VQRVYFVYPIRPGILQVTAYFAQAAKEAGKMLAKQLSYLAGAEGAGIVLGARVPIVLTSRADSVRTRLASTAVLTQVANARRTGQPVVR
jgi:hypothetical protein